MIYSENLNSAGRDEAARRNAASRSLLFSPRLFEFPRLCGSHTRRGQADCCLPRRRILLRKGTRTCFGGRSPQPGRAGSIQSRECVRRAPEVFQLGMTAEPEVRGDGKQSIASNLRACSIMKRLGRNDSSSVDRTSHERLRSTTKLLICARLSTEICVKLVAPIRTSIAFGKAK